MARHGPEGLEDVKALHNAANWSIALVSMLPDGVAIKMGHNLQGGAATPTVSYWCNNRLSIARRHELQ